MSAICHGFVQNAWRKDICSNCFRVRDEHSLTEINNSVKCNGTSSSSSSNNGANISPIVYNSGSNHNSSGKSGNEINVICADSNSSQGKGISISNRGTIHRFQGTHSNNTVINVAGASSPHGQVSSSSSSSSGIPRISNGTTITASISGGCGGKFSGTNSPNSSGGSTTLPKGYSSHTVNSRSHHNENNESCVTSPLSETKVKVSTEATAKTTTTTLPSPLSSTCQPQLQGKGVMTMMMTNQHPSKSDNGSVIPNHNNNKQSMSSSVGLQQGTGRNSCTSSVSSSSSSSSSFIASKNIFNNASTTTSSTVSGVTGFTTTGSSSCVLNVSNSSSSSGGIAASGSSGLMVSHSQSATSIKRGNINSFTSSSSSSASSTTQQQIQRSGVVDVTSCNGGGADGTSYRNVENLAKNGVTENRREYTEVVSNTSATTGGVVISVNKGAMLKGRAFKPLDVADGESVDRRKVVGFSSANDPVSHGKVSNAKVTPSNYRGILRSKTGTRKKDKNVRFPDEVVAVIGYGGGPSGTSDDEDDAPPHPLDNASVTEVMEKNSTTSEEKELHRVTQKNTNFNSIKTNLLGTTCIEIGPIVGCTGGKSMEGSSKPLVSIGTFETRKEPLRIQKKISEDSADDELNEKTVEKHRKFIQRSNAGGTNTSNTMTGKTVSSQAQSKIASMPNTSNHSSKEMETKQQQQSTTQQSLSSSSVIANAKNTTSANSNKTSSSTFSSSTATTLNKAILSTSKTSSSSSNKSAAQGALSFEKGNGSSTIPATTIEVNPEQTSSTSSHPSHNTSTLRNSRECITTVSTSETRSARSSIISQGGTTVTTSRSILSSSSNSGSNASSPSSKWNNSNSTTESSAAPARNKPILKRTQQHQTKSPSESAEAYTVNAAVVETSDTQKISSVGTTTSNTTNLNSRNNLIILTSADKGKVSSSSIASKRSSFLRDIIVDSSSSTTTIDSTGGIELREPSGSSSAAVQVICKNNEKAGTLVKSELKVDLKPSVNNGKLSHPPFGECLSNRSNGTDDSSEFDDSLEDSGLDIKKCSEISESDEKSGSGSDSGNENDFSDRDRMTIISTTGPKSGLFISVEEVEGTTKKPEKLSPDSVLFSSASEMSASGSSESIPEALDTISNGSSQKVPSTSGESTASGNTGVNGNGVKRAAPKPPSGSTKDSSTANNTIYANSQTSVVEVEGIYDDVSFYKNPMHFPLKKGDKISAFEEEDEENIYDDCNTITAIPKGNVKTGGKSAIGSYNFQNGSHNALDSDGEEEAEKVVHRRSDGIEFIGIRKIDSESFLRERSPSPEKNPDGKRERSSSASPKTRRRVNQFFSTIGKKAGAAFSQHVHGYSKHKHPALEDTVTEKSAGTSSNYKRSHSTDEVSMTRTQEIYATLTPTSARFRGLAPVLHKLSKIDLNLGDRDKGHVGDDDRTDSKDKGFKKHKISSSIKKFLKFGSKDGEPSGHKYDFGNKTELNGSGKMITTQISEESLTDCSPSRTPTPTAPVVSNPAPAKPPERRPSYATISGRPPPPPPPRVHSLDLLNRVGVVGPGGTVRPARPPPPARHNRVAPSFTSVFTNPNAESENKPNGSSNDTSSAPNNTARGNTLQHYSTINGGFPDPNNPPSKPKRKASMNLDCVTNGMSRDLETSYNHITTLNLETLKLIASQTPTKIRRNSPAGKRSSSGPLKWSQFYLPDPSKPLIQGHGFVFYTALLDDESCILLVQESATAPHFSAPFEFPCVETSATFEDFIPASYVTWQASEYVTNGSNVKVFVSVMPKFNMYTVVNYMRQSQVPLLHKYFALLQAMNFWDKEEMSDLVVLVQNTEEGDNHFLTTAASRGAQESSQQPSWSPSSVLVYVHPIPRITMSGSKAGIQRNSSKTQICTEFESSMKQILLTNGSDGSAPLLGENDRQVLLKRLNENKTKISQEQFRLFLQVKLFAPKRDSDELERIKKLRSERAIQQWVDRERAMCMKEAVEQTLQRNIESSISPYKRSYVEFLLTPENSAKAVLEMLIDLLE